MYEGPLKNIQHLYLYGSVTRFYGSSILILDEIRMICFLIASSHPCIYGAAILEF